MSEQRQRTRHRKNKPKRGRKKIPEKPKRFNYDLDNPPCMTFRGVCEFLGESPLLRKKARVWNTFDKVFDLYWGSDDSDIKRRSGWNQKYRQGLRKAEEMLVEIDEGGNSPESLVYSFREMLKTEFEFYFPCLPASSSAKWIAPNGGSQNTATWLAFCRNGTQDSYAKPPDEDLDGDHSWTWNRMTIKWDRMFHLSARDIVKPEMMEELSDQRQIGRFKSYDSSQRDFVYYQDEESGQKSFAELKRISKERQQRRKRKNIENRKRQLAFEKDTRPKRSAEENALFEKKRRLLETVNRLIKKNKTKEQEEKRIQAPKNYRILKEHLTPAKVYQRMFR